MKIWLLLDGERRRCELRCEEPYGDHAAVEGDCPLCGSKNFGVEGTGQRPSADDQAWEADGVSTCCKRRVGTIRAEMSTLFGVREDEAVLHGRCRVY